MTRYTALLATYVAVGFLTFGWVYNRAECHVSICALDKGTLGLMAGGLWPVYWAGKGAIALTRPAEVPL